MTVSSTTAPSTNASARLTADPRVAQTPLVTVVMATYNYAHYLPTALASALAQTVSNIEVIVVDDGSTDNTREVVERFAADPRVRYLYQSNGGHGAAKNAGVRAARGTFIGYLDADDAWDPRKLEKQLPLFEDPSVGVVYSRMEWMDPSGARRPYDRIPERLRPRRGRVVKHLFFDNFVPFSSSVVRASCYKTAGLMDEKLPMGNDWDLWLRVALTHRFEFVDEPLLFYRVGHGGQMSKNSEGRRKCAEKIMQKFVAQHPKAVPRHVIRQAWAYTCRSRGYRESDAKRSFGLYLAAIRFWPLDVKAYRGLARLTIATGLKTARAAAAKIDVQRLFGSGKGRAAG
jgi:glycosyltransferase involved in cell wall biosynthesis